jgi:hypothetical protein
MSKITNIFEEFEKRSGQVVITHGEETLKIAKELSNLIAGLPLCLADNDRLVYLMKDQLMAAEREQFLAGFDLGLKMADVFKDDRRSK